MALEYVLKPTSEGQSEDEMLLIEVRNGKQRVVSREHHSYRKFIANKGKASISEYVAHKPAPAMMQSQARAQAVNEGLAEFIHIVAMQECFDCKEVDDSLIAWRDRVAARALELEG